MFNLRLFILNCDDRQKHIAKISFFLDYNTEESWIEGGIEVRFVISYIIF